jgi:membrane fusion protein (multidrug efflux system)
MTDTPKPKKNLPKIILGTIVLLGSIYGYTKYRHATTHEETDNAQIETYFVPILPRVAGFVKTVNAHDYEQVKQGTVLVEIDSEEAKLALSEMEVDLDQARIDVTSAKANLVSLQKAIVAQQVSVKTAEYLKSKAERDLNRNAELEKAKAITHQQYIDSKDQVELANIKYYGAIDEITSTKSKLAIQESAVKRAENLVKNKEVKIAQQKLKLGYYQVLAPVSGKIGKKAIEPGQFIQVSQPLMTIVDNNTFWVVANFKETQVQHLHAGMEAELTIDAFPKEKIKGKVVSISESTGAKTSLLPPDNASGNFVKVTQRIPVKIEIMDLAKYKSMLRAGMSLEVSIPLN